MSHFQKLEIIKENIPTSIQQVKASKKLIIQCPTAISNLMEDICIKENISPHELYNNKPALRRNNGDLSADSIQSFKQA